MKNNIFKLLLVITICFLLTGCSEEEKEKKVITNAALDYLYTKYNIEKNKIENKIQAHENMINVIEINYILKIIITSGDDNYIYIRKLYDFELLTFIKIHNNYSIKTIKMNRMNLIYCLCSYENLSNKDDEDYGIQSKIFGYTVTGIQFANYSSKDLLGNDFYFTNNLNILVNKYGTNEFLILNSFDLS